MLNPAAPAVGAPPFRAVFARRPLIILVALLLGETTINYIDRRDSMRRCSSASGC
jgi:hypothetical protein